MYVRVCIHRLCYLLFKRTNSISKTKKFSLLSIWMKWTNILHGHAQAHSIYSITGTIFNYKLLCFVFSLLTILQLQFPYLIISWLLLLLLYTHLSKHKSRTSLNMSTLFQFSYSSLMHQNSNVMNSIGAFFVVKKKETQTQNCLITIRF